MQEPEADDGTGSCRNSEGSERLPGSEQIESSERIDHDALLGGLHEADAAEEEASKFAPAFSYSWHRAHLSTAAYIIQMSGRVIYKHRYTLMQMLYLMLTIKHTSLTNDTAFEQVCLPCT